MAPNLEERPAREKIELAIISPAIPSRRLCFLIQSLTISSVGSGTFIEDFKQGLEFTPVEGRPNVYSIRPRRNGRESENPEPTAEEWDKFEKDVGDAFERVP